MQCKLICLVLTTLVQADQIYSFTAFVQQPNAVPSANGGPLPPTPPQNAAGNTANVMSGFVTHSQIRIQKRPHNSDFFPAPQTVFHHPHHANAAQLFYKECGSSIRHCDWVQPQRRAGRGNVARTHQQHLHAQQAHETNAKVEMEYTCSTTRFVCVGNSEGCVSNKTCSVAMKITESTVEVRDKVPSTMVLGLACLSSCDAGEQSASEFLTRPQLLAAIGFATYDESGENLECRFPKASDFKLVYLWRNSSVEEAYKHTGYCAPRPNGEAAIQYYDGQIMAASHAWPKICKSMENKHEQFSLKTFLDNHAPITVFTDFFRPPLNFADNFDYQTSENGMLISGSVH